MGRRRTSSRRAQQYASAIWPARFKRWKQIGGAPREAQEVFGISGGANSGREMTPGYVAKVVEGFRLRVLDMVDPNPKNVVGASVLHTSEGGKFGCLMRLEPNYQSQMIRLTIRATEDTVAPILLKLLQDRLSAGVLTAPEPSPSHEQISDAFGNIMVT